MTPSRHISFISCAFPPGRPVLRVEAMGNLVENVDAEMDAALEEELMVQAELECLQNEAEIARNTRFHEGMLLPYFGDEEQMMSEILVGDVVNDNMDDSPCVELAATTEKQENPFSVMTKALFETLKRQVTESTESGEEHLEVKRRTSHPLIV